MVIGMMSLTAGRIGNTTSIQEQAATVVNLLTHDYMQQIEVAKNMLRKEWEAHYGVTSLDVLDKGVMNYAINNASYFAEVTERVDSDLVLADLVAENDQFCDMIMNSARSAQDKAVEIIRSFEALKTKIAYATA